MDKLDEKLSQLIRDTCQHPRGSLKRQRGMTEIIKLIQRKLWKDNSNRFYGDALQRTWLYFCRNLCEATTGQKFDPERSSVITWLNAYLKLELRKFRCNENEQRMRFVSEITTDTGEVIDPLETVAAPRDIPPIVETSKKWLETDPTGELRSTHMSGHPEITCQAILLRRFLSEKSWKDISAEFNVPLQSLNTFNRRYCQPLLKKFAEEEGWDICKS
ncbi:MAG: sigma-70 family RNA polymerase sigma factor [Cyanobacteria bacterium P01_D01_bin.116]